MDQRDGEGNREGGRGQLNVPYPISEFQGSVKKKLHSVKVRKVCLQLLFTAFYMFLTILHAFLLQVPVNKYFKVNESLGLFGSSFCHYNWCTWLLDSHVLAWKSPKECRLCGRKSPTREDKTDRSDGESGLEQVLTLFSSVILETRRLAVTTCDDAPGQRRCRLRPHGLRSQ